MVFRSLVASLSRSSRSETSLSRVLTSTGLAAPNGLGFVFPEGGVGPIFGEDNGLGEAEGFPDRGRSSNFLRVAWGVGGVELLGDTRELVLDLRQSPSST